MDKYLFHYNTSSIFDSLYQKIQNQQNPSTIPKPSYLICSKCDSNLIWIETKQVRSFDEGETSFMQCYNCNYKWKN